MPDTAEIAATADLDLNADAEQASAAYGSLTRRRIVWLTALIAGLAACLLTDIGVGPAGYSPLEVLMTILDPAGSDAAQRVIVWDIRLPVALTAVVVGAGLAVAGAEMQTILNNPLASPFTLGISAAASFGAALAIVLGVSVLPVAADLVIAANAFVFAMIASMAIYVLSRMREVSAETLILLGIALVFAFNALLALLQYLASEQALQEVVFWTLGSLGKATWPKVAIAAAVLALVIPVLVRNAWALTALRLGDDPARSMGVDAERLRLRVLALVSVLSAVAVAFVGTVGFVGLVGPHIARILVGEDHRFFLPASAVAGALLLSATSLISKSIVPGVIFPIGIITALVGVPVFLTLVLTRKRQAFQ